MKNEPTLTVIQVRGSGIYQRQHKTQKYARTLLASQSGVAEQNQLLTVDEFADQLRVSRACVRKWILQRSIAIVKVGRLVRLPLSELRRIVDKGTRPALRT